MLTYQCRLARTLNTIQPEEEWRDIQTPPLMLLLVQLQTFENEGYAVLGLVVNDLRHPAAD